MLRHDRKLIRQTKFVRDAMPEGGKFIPKSLRARLIERLNLYVEYELARQYKKLYDLLSESTIERIYRGQSRAEFVAASHKGDAKGTSIRNSHRQR